MVFGIFVAIWLFAIFFLGLVCCTNKNLATLLLATVDENNLFKVCYV
jgi:hypothetical protein